MNIEDFRNKHKGQRCFLLGSGPSLADMDLSGLKNEITFSCNRGYLLFEKLGFATTYWALEDPLDMEQFGSDYENFIGPIKFVSDDLPFSTSHCSVSFIRDINSKPRFAVEPPFYFGGTVMFMMLQLARFMGCSTAYLLGNDFKWDLKNVSINGNQCWRTLDTDDNHFDSTYWPKGARSFPPQPERMRKSFFAARNNGIQIINVTPNSALDVFEKDDFNSIMDGSPRKTIGMEQHTDEIDPFCDLLRTIKPKHVIEIGVRSGGTSALWHQICTGLVIGIDTYPNWLENRFPRFRGILGDSQSEETLNKVEELLDEELVDLLFIDGNHSFEASSNDYENYKRFVNVGGLIAFHDINAEARHFESWENGGIPRFWNSLQLEKQVFSVNSDWGGIGVVRA